MPKHKVEAKARTEEGKVVDMRLPTIAPLVECAVENEDGETSAMPLDKLLANHADEINSNTKALGALKLEVEKISDEDSSEMQQTLDEINSKAGLESDNTTKATIFGRIKQIFEYLTTNLSPTRANKIDLIGEANPSVADMTTVMNALKMINGAIPKTTVQRGVASTAGIVTIAAVDMSKSFVISVSKGSEGTVAVNGTVAAHGVSGNIAGTLSGKVYPDETGHTGVNKGATFQSGTAFTDWHMTTNLSGTRTLSGTAAAAAISGGITDVTVKQFSAKLISETELSIDGACEWQVITNNFSEIT